MTTRKSQIQSKEEIYRKLRAISDCNQALLRAKDEQPLLNEICRVVCEDAGYSMAWVGFAEQDEACTLSPRAWFGFKGDFSSMDALTWADCPEGMCPCGSAIRSGKTSYIQDVTGKEGLSQSVEYAISRDFRSVIALPLKDDKGHTFGVLCIYSDQALDFTQDEINLLEELSGDLAFGITSLRLKAKQKTEEQQLAASEQLFRTLVENSPDNISRYGRDLRRIYVNPALQRLFGKPVEQLLGDMPTVNSPLVDPERFMANLSLVIEEATECSDEIYYRGNEGDIRCASARFVPEFDANSEVVSVLVISRDTTKDKQAEEEKKDHLFFLESMDRINKVLHGEGDIEQVMNRALDEILEIFGCDRAFLVYPCDPRAATWSVPFERNRPEYPGAQSFNLGIPMDEYVASSMRVMLNSDHPVQMGSGTEYPVEKSLQDDFSIRSFIAMALQPKVDKPWQFGIHQCSYDRVWADHEMRLFEEIGRRISDGLNTLLVMRNMRASEERYRLLFENSPLPIIEDDYSAVKVRMDELRKICDGDIEPYLIEHPEVVRECVYLVRTLNINHATQSFLGLDFTNVELSLPSQIAVDESHDSLRGLLMALSHGQTEYSFESLFSNNAGDLCKVNVYVTVCSGYEESLGKVLVSLVDITERERSEERLRLAASVFANSQEGIMISDVDNRIIDINPAFTLLTGYTSKDVLGKNPSMLSAGNQSAEFYADMWRSIHEYGEWQGEVWNRRKSGEVYAELLSIVAVKDNEGELKHYVGAFTDISKLKEHEAELDHIAHYDMLTSVPNRRLLHDRLEQAIARSHRSSKKLAVCYLDLDGFKPINDRFGHESGDRMLVEIARRLEWVSRSDDTVARLGGDEFVLLWNDITSEADCTHALDRVLAKVSEPMELDDTPISISASIGVTLYPDDDVDADTLLRHADQAMYSAKRLGKNHYQMFDVRLERQIASQFEFLLMVEKGLDAGQFELYYQPKVDCVTGAIYGCEALIRWNDPVLGLVGPSEFIPVIEGESLAFRMGRWVLEQAVLQARAWSDKGISIPVSINIFPNHLKNPIFITDVRSAIAKHWPDMPNGSLLFEIVETSDLEDLEPIESVINECLNMGIGFSLDDFGTGYSSLVYLRRLSIEELKIDQSFVRDMLNDPDDQAIVEGVIGLGKAFGLRVVAEGVETIEQARHLEGLGCSIAQGFGLGRPMQVNAFEQWYTDFTVHGVRGCK